MAAAHAMHARQAELNARWETKGLPPFHLGIGLSTGDVAAALLGSDERLEYSVVGDAVNLAQRLQQWARGRPDGAERADVRGTVAAPRRGTPATRAGQGPAHAGRRLPASASRSRARWRERPPRPTTRHRSCTGARHRHHDAARGLVAACMAEQRPQRAHGAVRYWAGDRDRADARSGSLSPRGGRGNPIGWLFLSGSRGADHSTRRRGEYADSWPARRSQRPPVRHGRRG